MTTIFTNGNPDYSSGATDISDSIQYQWQVSTDNGSTWLDMSGENTTVLSLANTTTDMNGNRYRVVMHCTSDQCETVSEEAIVVINSAPVQTIDDSLTITQGESGSVYILNNDTVN